MEALQANVAGLKNLSDALDTFNEGFASWLYVMNMNALTTDWPQAPTDASYKLAARRAGMGYDPDAIFELRLRRGRCSCCHGGVEIHTGSDIAADVYC